MREALKQETRAVAKKPRDAGCTSYAPWLYDCYLLQLTKGQGRFSTGTPAVTYRL